MTLEVIDYVEKYRNESLNIGELINGTKIPKGENGKIIWHNEINGNTINPQDGLCVFCGITSNNLMVLDLDDETLFEYFKIYQDQTLIVKTGKKGFHIYFRTYENPKSRSLTNSQGQHIDILGQGKIAVLPPSIHPDTKRLYEIISDKKIKQITTQEEQGLYQKLKDLGFNPEEKKPITELHDKNFVKSEGQNRAEDLLRVIDSWKIKNPELTELMLFLMANEYQKEHFTEQYPDDKIKSLVKQGFEFGQKKIAGREVKEETKLKRTFDLIDLVAGKIMIEKNIVTNMANDNLLIHSGKIYKQSSTSESIIKARAEEIIPECTTHESIEVLNKIKRKTGIELEQFDTDPNLISIDNGILDVNTIQLSSHTPKHLSTVLIPVEYQKPQFEINDETIFEDIEKNLKDTLFLKFLKSSFTVNGEFKKEDFETILEITASFFIKTQIDEKAFMFLGRGENGKSVLTDYIINMLGLDNVEKIQLQELTEDKYMGAKLVGKLANIFSDLESYELKHTGKIKNLTSGEGIEVQHKYGDPFMLIPFCKFLFSCNRFPKVDDQSQGFFRRWIIVKWRRNFENDPEKDEHLKQKLKDNQEEKNLVFSTLIHLSRLLLKNGKFTHSKDWKDTQEEWNANAEPLNNFVEKYIIDSDGDKTVRETYHFYRQIMTSKQERALGIAQFGKAFREYFEQMIEKKEGRTERVWKYIDFKIPKIGDYDEE